MINSISGDGGPASAHCLRETEQHKDLMDINIEYIILRKLQHRSRFGNPKRRKLFDEWCKYDMRRLVQMLYCTVHTLPKREHMLKP